MDHPTNSLLTLVDTHGPTPLEEDIVLIFDRDDMCNTTLHIPGSHLPSYAVNTQNDTTTVCAGDVLLATIKRRMFGSDQITFPGCRPMSLGRWLRAPLLSALPLVFHAYGRRFKWRKDSLGQLVLYESKHPDETLAWFSNSRGEVGSRVTHAAYLTIKPAVAEVRDMIVLSCILAEYKLRIIDVMAAAQFKVAMYMMAF